MNIEDKVNREIMKAAVAHAITCQVTGEVLDYRTAVLIENAKGRTLACISPEGWRIRKDALLAAMPDIRVTNAPTD